MVARALQGSEALRVVPWLRAGFSDQGTTLRASDLHNARATIFNPFNNAQRESWLTLPRVAKSQT